MTGMLFFVPYSAPCGGLLTACVCLHHRDRWTPSQALPSPLNADALVTLSVPREVWSIPLADVVADRGAVQHLDVELTSAGVYVVQRSLLRVQSRRGVQGPE